MRSARSQRRQNISHIGKTIDDRANTHGRREKRDYKTYGAILLHLPIFPFVMKRTDTVSTSFAG